MVSRINDSALVVRHQLSQKGHFHYTPILWMISVGVGSEHFWQLPIHTLLSLVGCYRGYCNMCAASFTLPVYKQHNCCYGGNYCCCCCTQHDFQYDYDAQIKLLDRATTTTTVNATQHYEFTTNSDGIVWQRVGVSLPHLCMCCC